MQGDEYTDVSEALRGGRLGDLPVTEPERLLLAYVDTVTRHAYRVTDSQVEELRLAGWTDEQIAEATYVAALFSLFVRLADAFDIHPDPVMDPDGVPLAVTDGTTGREPSGVPASSA